VTGTAQGYWNAKHDLLCLISRRISADLDTPVFPGWSEQGTTFTPLFDLDVRIVAGYGWAPRGVATDATPDDLRLRRGARIVFNRGEQEQCPGGPGENILHLDIEPGSDSPTGGFTISYDPRSDFGENLSEYLLVRPDEPVLTDPDRLAALADDIARCIAEAPDIAFSWRDEVSGRTFGAGR
jgi:hypothetical protein